MSYDFIEEETIEVILEAQAAESSVEPSMSEWSSLMFEIHEGNLKKKLCEQGLYDPGSGEICAAYVKLSDSAVLRHPYYNYPCISDPGIADALLKPPPIVTFPSDGQEYYQAICRDMHQCPVRLFHRGLLQERIDLGYYGINPKGVRAMSMALEKNSFVTYLNLTDNWLNDDACFHLGRMLERNSTLVELNMYGCRIGYSGSLRLCEGLITNRSLRVLNLGNNHIGDDGLGNVANAISLLSEIRELDLSNNGISGKGCEMLAEALETQNKLTYVNLSHNNLYSFVSGLYSVLELLGSNPEFQYLNLAWNCLSGTKIAAGIKSVFQSKGLHHVVLNNNRLSGTETMSKMIGWFAKPKKMKCFDLSYNPLTLKDALHVIEKFRRSKIQELNLDGVNVDQNFVNVLNEIHQKRKNAVVIHGYVQGGLKSKGPDARELLLNRIEYIGKRNKKHQMDIALFVLQLLKEKITSMTIKDLTYRLKETGVFLDEDLLSCVQDVFPGPTTKKGGKTIGLQAMAEYIQRKWPDRKLPPTPPPEPEPEPEPIKAKKGKKGKNKGK